MERRGEQGYALIALVVMVFLVMLALGVAAPRVAKELRRENEVEAMHRGDQYTRAIRVFYRKNGAHYPSSIEQLEKTNNVRYLRQRYVDPVTGKDDWRLIHLGEAKTTAKGFFGQPLAGIATSPVGSMQGLSTPGTPIGASSSAVGAGASGSPGSGFGQSSGSGFGGSSSAFGSSASPGFSSSAGAGASNTAVGAAGGNAAGSSASGGAGTQSSTSGSQPLGAGGPVIGVGTGASGDSIVELNEQTSYETWEFVYDPRIEQLYGKATLMGGAGTSAGGLGSGSGSSIAPNNPNGPSSNSPFGTSPGTSPTSPTSPGSNSPFGNSPGSSPFGSSPTR
jgi:type II secretory pathway pseudopilin PulG